MQSADENGEPWLKLSWNSMWIKRDYSLLCWYIHIRQTLQEHQRHNLQEKSIKYRIEGDVITGRIRNSDFQRKTASVAMKKCCNHPKQYRNKVTTTLSCHKNRGCESFMARGWERWLVVEDSAIDMLCCFIPLDPWVCWSFLEGVRLVPLFQYKKWL